MSSDEAFVAELVRALEEVGLEAIVVGSIAALMRSIRSRCVEMPVGEHKALVASLEDVIRSKEAAGRPKDLAQLPILRDTLRVRRALES